MTVPAGAWLQRCTFGPVQIECDCQNPRCRRYFVVSYLWSDGKNGMRFWLSKS